MEPWNGDGDSGAGWTRGRARGNSSGSVPPPTASSAVPSPDSLSPEVLLADSAWLRRLARRLTGDAERAADLQQDVALAALDAADRSRIGRAWLAAVARRLAALVRRRSARESARLRRLPLPQAAPAAAELVAAAELQQRAVAAVLALPPQYRDTVLMRFLRGLSLEETARQLGVGVETVRTRQKRALARLRAQLGTGRRPVRPALAFLLPPGRRPARLLLRVLVQTGMLTTGVVMKKKFAGLAVALLVLGIGSTPFWIGSSAAPDSRRPAAPVPAAADSRRAGAQHGADGAAAGAAPRREVAPIAAPPAPAETAIEVRVAWADDGTPAGERLILCREANGPATFASTAADGRVRFGDLEPGQHFVCDASNALVPATARSGETVEVALSLPRGYAVRGRVVDAEERPVPFAEIVVQHGAQWPAWVFAAGRADGGGRFAVDGLAGTQMITARDAHHGVCDGQVLDALPDGTVWPGEVVLRFAGAGRASLRGRVVDDLQRPVAGAWVQVQPQRYQRTLADGRTVASPPGELARSDADGAFSAGWLAPGEHVLHVYRRGYAPHRRALQIADREPQAVTVVLQPGATLAGTVRDGAGEPVAGAYVEVQQLEVPQQAMCTTGPDGAFRFADLPPGDLDVVVTHARHSRQAHRITVAGTEAHAWDCVLTAAGVVRGRLLDAEGKPLGGWFVQRPRSARFGRTDDDGRFTCAGCAPRGNVLLVRPRSGLEPVRARFADVAAGPDEQTFVVPAGSGPSAHLRGRCLGPDGAPLPGVVMHLHQELLHVHDGTRSRGDGTFDVGPLPPGSYRLAPLHADCEFEATDVQVRAHEHLELPVLRGRVLPGR